MTVDTTTNRRPWHRRSAMLLALIPFLLAGCDRPEIRSYRVAKETSSSPVTWAKLPDGWAVTENSRMSVAAFLVGGEGGQTAEITATPLPPLGGRETDIVNMWRQQVGQPALGDDEAAKQLQPVAIGGEEGQLFEISSSPTNSEPTRIVTAMLHRKSASWFFKLSGDPAVVDAQKPAFVEFLKTVRVNDAALAGAAHSMAARAPAPHSAPPPPQNFKWKVPEGWQPAAPGPMQNAKFSVPASGGAAEVSVSIFPSDTGGTLANVNRWRGQIGLGAATESDLASLVTPLTASPGALLVDMANNGRQFIGAIVPRGGQWYFYKLLGEAAAVAPQKEKFVEFVKSEP
ncbi:MAG: hypothetical protein HZA89_10600 [Verrucomicrobia bacterium]|nr:hypothetical protein [Verrucomicrobiota bacterium]